MSEVEAMDDEPGSPGPPPLEDQNGMEVTAPVQRSARAIQAEISQRLMRERERKRLNLTALNPYIVCAICKGYLIDPVTVVECLHSFCKSCIVKHVERSKFCPTCDTQIHKTKPLLSLRADKALQDIVYRVVPGLYRAEMRTRVRFYSAHPEAEPTSLEDAGEVTDRLFFSPEDDISMSIEYFDNYSKTTDDINRNRMAPEGPEKDNPNRRFLQCPGSVTIHHLKKFIMNKYGLDSNFLVDVIYKEDLLPEDLTLIDVAYSYDWRKTSPMRFYYRIYQKTKVLTRKRKKKRTRAASGHQTQPAKKLRTMAAAPALAWNGGGPQSGNNTHTTTEHDNNSMETDAPAPCSAATAAGTADSKASAKVKEKTGASVSQANNKAILQAQTGKAATADVIRRPPPPMSLSMPTPPPAKLPSPSHKHVNDAKKGHRVENKAPLAGGSSKTGGAATASPAAPAKSLPTAALPAQKATPVITSTPTVNQSMKLGAVGASKPAITPPPVTPKPRAALASITKTDTLPEGKSRETESKNGGTGKVVNDKPLPLSGPKIDLPPTAGKKPEPELKDKPAVLQQSHDRGSATKLTMTSSEKKKPAAPAPRANKEVVEISVEVSASDVKKVLEKKRAEKDAAAATAAAKQMISNGEERLYSNYSIVDQIKKAGTARQQQVERASMMDFARSSEALANSGPARVVPPTIQGLQPRLPPPQSSSSSSSETTTTGLSAIVQSLAQKQQKIQQAGKGTGSETPPSSHTTAVAADSMDTGAKTTSVPPSKASLTVETSKRTSPKPTSEPTTKTLGAIVAPTLNSKGVSVTQAAGCDKLLQPPATSVISNVSAASTSVTTSSSSSSVLVPQLPGSTSIQAIGRDGKASPTAVETSGAAGQQMLSFYKNSFAAAKAGSSSSNNLSDASKSAESLTKNIPAGTTVTVKTIENKVSAAAATVNNNSAGVGKTSPVPLPATSSPAPSSPKNAPFRMSMSSSSSSPFASSSSKTIANPYASMVAVSQASLINPYVHSTLRDSMTMALAAQQAQYLNFSNQPFGAAAAFAAQMVAANFDSTTANLVRAAQVAAQLSSQTAVAAQSSPMTTLEFTKPSPLGGHHGSEDHRFGGLKIPQPVVSRSLTSASGPLGGSSFGTSRLQLKVNSDSPAEDGLKKLSASPPVTTAYSSSVDAGSPSQHISGTKHVVGTHAMPAILPFHGVKKVQALPKTAGQTLRPSLAAKSQPHSHQASPPGSPLSFSKPPTTTANVSSPLMNTIQSLTDSNPFKTSTPVAPSGKTVSSFSPAQFDTLKKVPTPPAPLGNNAFRPTVVGGQQAANNSLKKLAADLNTAQQKALKGDNNILSALKKSSSLDGSNNKLADFGGVKGFGGKTTDVKKVVDNGGGRKEVTTSS